MKKIFFLSAVSIMLACGDTAMAYKIQQQKKAPATRKNTNILLLIAHGLRADPPYESDALKAWKKENLPFQSMMAERGILFQNHYSNTTGSLPAKATLHTGQYPVVHGVMQSVQEAGASEGSGSWSLQEAVVPTIGNWLQQAGYKTFFKGDWQLSDSSLRLQSGALLTPFDEYGVVREELADFYAKKNILAPFGYDGWVGPDARHNSFLDAASSLQEPFIGRDQKTTDALIKALEDLEREAAPWLLVGSYLNPSDINLMDACEGTYPFAFDVDPTLPEELFTKDFVVSLLDLLTEKPLAQQHLRRIHAQRSEIGDPAAYLALGSSVVEFLLSLIILDIDSFFSISSIRDKHALLPVLRDPARGKIDPALLKSYMQNVLGGAAPSADYTKIAQILKESSGCRDGLGKLDLNKFLALYLRTESSLESETAALLLGNLLHKLVALPDVIRYYYTLQKKLDHEMMRVWQVLTASSMRDNTVVIVTADHGALLGVHGLLFGELYQAYQEAIAVPLMVYIPSSDAAPGAITQLTSHVDLLPTLLDIAQVDTAGVSDALFKNFKSSLPLPGTSLLRLIKGGQTADSVVYFYTQDHHNPSLMPQPCAVEAVMMMVNEELWKITRYYDPFQKTPEQAYELYNLAQDPTELTNLYDQLEAASIKNKALAALAHASARNRGIPGYEQV